MKEKLLFLGVDTSTKYAVDYAKRIGVTTIITDYYPNEKSPVKQMADEAWEIDVKDLDVLEQRCKENGVTGIYAGSRELCLDMAQELTKRLHFPFYASDEGWRCARDKARFKKRCMEAGLNVPRRYPLTDKFEPAVLSEIVYPVIVKPVDSCAAQGISVCHNEEELRFGYEKALENSESKQIIVEEYIDGQEMTAHYFVYDGEVSLIYLHKPVSTIQVGKKYLCLTTNQCEEYEEYVKQTKVPVQRLLSNMNCRYGHLFLQLIEKDNKFYFFEMGYRLDGVGSWTITQSLYGFNAVNLMVELALGHALPAGWNKAAEENIGKEIGLVYLMGANKGKIARINGMEYVKSMEGVEVVLERCHEGDEQRHEGNMRQAIYYLTIVADSSEKAVQKIQEIHEHLAVYDENGNDMLIRFQNFDALLANKKREE